MTTTSIHPGHSVSGVLNHPEWGEGYTESERKQLDGALIEKFEELARAATGDDSISYQPYTSEILYECWGQTTREHHCMAPMTAWPRNEDGECEIDWGELAREAGEWSAENIETILGESE
jgi:hypothetical protein